MNFNNSNKIIIFYQQKIKILEKIKYNLVKINQKLFKSLYIINFFINKIILFYLNFKLIKKKKNCNEFFFSISIKNLR